VSPPAGTADPSSAAVVAGRAFGLADGPRDLGPAIHWALRRGADSLTILAEPDVAPDLARRAALIDFEIEVRSIEGAEAVVARPRPAVPVPDLDDDMWRAATVIVDAGARVVDDHGRLVAEVLGLEVARIEDPLALVGLDTSLDNLDPTDRFRIRIGVGEADRELDNYLSRRPDMNRETDDRLRLERVISLVEMKRTDPAHPLSRMARPRWLRSIVLDEPEMIELAELETAAPLRPHPGVFDREPSAAYSLLDRVTVVCSSGIDLDLLPEAVDYRERLDPGSRLMVVVPHRDAAMIRNRWAPLVPNCEIRSIDAPWDTAPSGKPLPS
jgi:hypothetical protein